MSQDTVEGKDFIEESGGLHSEAQQEQRGWVTYCPHRAEAKATAGYTMWLAYY